MANVSCKSTATFKLNGGSITIKNGRGPKGKGYAAYLTIDAREGSHFADVGIGETYKGACEDLMALPSVAKNSAIMAELQRIHKIL